jgi:hypothetical protein
VPPSVSRKLKRHFGAIAYVPGRLSKGIRFTDYYPTTSGYNIEFNPPHKKGEDSAAVFQVSTEWPCPGTGPAWTYGVHSINGQTVWLDRNNDVATVCIPRPGGLAPS